MALSSPSSIIVKELLDRETIRFTLEWTIKNVKKLRTISGPLRSVGITMRELEQDSVQGRWRALVKPCTTKTEEGVSKCYFGVSLSLTDISVESVSYTSDKSVDVQYVIRVSTGKDASVVISSKGPLEHAFCRKEAEWGFQKMFSHNDLFGDDNKPGLLKDDSLTLVIDVMLYAGLRSVNALEMVTADSSKRYEQFVRRQAEALASNPRLQSTDFKIYSNDGKVFPTYRNLLMSHSPVFAAMLTHNAKEKRLSRCDLEDIDGETVGVVLDYVHGCDTGKVTCGNAEKVLIMADKYEILDLRAVCEEILSQNVIGENAVHCLVLASQRNLGRLKEAALNMIPKHIGTVLKNGALQEALQFDPELMQTIMEHCSKRMRLNDASPDVRA